MTGYNPHQPDRRLTEMSWDEERVVRALRVEALCELRPHFKGEGFWKFVLNQTRDDLWLKWLKDEPSLSEIYRRIAQRESATKIAAE